MTDHVLTIYFDGDEMAPVFKCHAKPSATGQPPACWTYLDEDGEFRVADHCNAKEWIEAEDPYFAKREITLEVEVHWNDDAPQVVVVDPAKRIAELEAELAKFQPCSLNEQGEPDAPPLHPAQTERGCMSFEHDGSQNSAWYCEIHGASVYHKEGER